MTSRPQPLNEGYVVKGGRNETFQITERPPPPRPLRMSSPHGEDPASLTVKYFLRIRELEHEAEMLRRDLAMERAKRE